MKIWADADASPVAIKEILFRAAERTGVKVTLVASQPIRVPASPHIEFVQLFVGHNAIPGFRPCSLKCGSAPSRRASADHLGGRTAWSSASTRGPRCAPPCPGRPRPPQIIRGPRRAQVLPLIAAAAPPACPVVPGASSPCRTRRANRVPMEIGPRGCQHRLDECGDQRRQPLGSYLPHRCRFPRPLLQTATLHLPDPQATFTARQTIDNGGTVASSARIDTIPEFRAPRELRQQVFFDSGAHAYWSERTG